MKDTIRFFYEDHFRGAKFIQSNNVLKVIFHSDDYDYVVSYKVKYDFISLIGGKIVNF